METEIIEKIASWVASGEFKTDFCPMDSEHSVLSAAVGASATGVRVFTATSSQGLELMHEITYIASGLRLPIVMVNCSRALSAPVALWSDHNDFLGLRDSGWIMVHAENNQEVFDSLVTGYKIAENENVLLPLVVNMDGYVLSNTMEPVILPEEKQIDSFLKQYNPKHAFFKPGKSMIQGGAVLNPEIYFKFRKQQHKAMHNVFEVAKNVYSEWKKITDRNYDFIEEFMAKDAEYIFITQGSISTSAKAAIINMRKKGERVGLLRLRIIRPFPKEAIKKAVVNKTVAVIDKNMAPGTGGIMYPEIKSTVEGHVSSFIGGIGGKPIKESDFWDILKQLIKDERDKLERTWFV